MKKYGKNGVIHISTLITFTMLLVEGSSETRLRRHLSNNVFRNPQVRKYISYEGHLLLKVSQILSTFEKWTKKNGVKAFSFFVNCIWIGCVKLSLLRGETLWPAVNGFTNSPKILHITKRDFFQFNCLHIDQ